MKADLLRKERNPEKMGKEQLYEQIRKARMGRKIYTSRWSALSYEHISGRV